MANTANVDNAAQAGKDKNYLGIEGILYTKEEFLQLPHEHGVPKVVWAFWGGGELNENRMRGITMMRDNLEVPVLLITPEHLHEFVLPDHPLHEGYQYLRALHQSDYMRAYLWHNYGGAWNDIKPTATSYKDAWQPFADPEIYFVGKIEYLDWHITEVHDETGEHWMKDCVGSVFSAAWWVGRANTPMSTLMMNRVHTLLDGKLKKLKKYPARYPFDTKGIRYPVSKSKPNLTKFEQNILRVYDYPLRWAEVFGEIYHPISFKYRNHISDTLPYDVSECLGYDYR